ncbi:hypothetical protein EUGRSUZ_D02403 [Eucalyptus grandis]|uniref:Uncharacterized protein n=2 Tax=Eucalyptus grandis TaxID=71139 RepID=A0ACC3L9X2_EUCGR|nr:hypothetical protein EUGRSUZ_D02403 [Eucalyptus grandis]
MRFAVKFLSLHGSKEDLRADRDGYPFTSTICFLLTYEKNINKCIESPKICQKLFGDSPSMDQNIYIKEEKAERPCSFLGGWRSQLEWAALIDPLHL